METLYNSFLFWLLLWVAGKVFAFWLGWWFQEGLIYNLKTQSKVDQETIRMGDEAGKKLLEKLEKEREAELKRREWKL